MCIHTHTHTHSKPYLPLALLSSSAASPLLVSIYNIYMVPGMYIYMYIYSKPQLPLLCPSLSLVSLSVASPLPVSPYR